MSDEEIAAAADKAAEWMRANPAPPRPRTVDGRDSERVTPSQAAILRALDAAGLPLTRQNYIVAAWGADPPDPWTPEHEAELPTFLQAEDGAGPGAEFE